MKRLFFVLIMICSDLLCSAILLSATLRSDPPKGGKVEIPITTTKAETPHPKSLSIPIEAEYVSSYSAICVRFNSNLGDVDIDVMNSSTGDMWSWTVVGGNIMAVLPISGDNGMYTITFTLANGDEYEGEFEL